MFYQRFATYLSVVFLVVACAETPKQYLSLKEFPSLPSDRVGVLRPGDTVDFKFQYWPELDDSQVIRPDGNVSLQLIGEVKAEGLTPIQFNQKLKELYTAKIKNPEITVIVRSLGARAVYVGGEIFTPGEIELKDKMTVLSAIMAAGGFNKTSAELKNIVVIRFLDNKYYATMVDLEAYLNNPQSEPLFLAAQDIVYVPRTRIIELNQWVDQNISKMLPKTGIVIDTTKSTGNATIHYGYSN
jgi:polysaccharide biosynthesis/export protein